MTGTNPPCTSHRTSAGSTSSGSPTKPRSTTVPSVAVYDDVRRGATEACVHARQPDGTDIGRHAGRDQIGIGRAGQDGHDGVERRAVGDAEAVDLAGRNLSPSQLGVDRPAAAMNDDEGPAGNQRRREPGDLTAV